MARTPDDPTRIALVGAGRWGANVLRDLLLLGCEVPVVARSDASIERARAGGATTIVDAIDRLPAVHGTVVATPTVTHAAVVREVAAATTGPIYVEKPLTDDADEADALAAELGDRLFVMDKWRYHPGVLELGRIARERELGAVTSIHSRRVTLGHRYDDVDTVWVHLPHDLAIALEILGELPPARSATEERMNGERVGLFATLGDGPVVTLEVSAVAPAHRRELRMVCEEGVAMLDGGWADELLIVRDVAGTPEPERRPVPGELPLLAELRAFAEHARDPEAPAPHSSAADAASIVRRIDELGALARSAGAVPR